MNTDVFEGRWKQMRGELRSWWGRLTDDDLEKIAGKKDRLVGVLQEKYGYTRQAAQQEVDRRFQEYSGRLGASASAGEATMSSQSTTYRTTPGGMADAAQEKGEEAAATAATKASQPISAVGEKIESLAEAIRDKAPHEGTIGTAATAVAEKLDAAGSYLQTKDFDHMVGDVSDVIRRYPIPSLLIGLGIGYLLARSTRR
jgi:uncharacterized protein YjbJ (UPF0337 family)